ncbi:antitoxin ParD1/3/4 [Geoalkalibacter ferrihydriticus]|uniref:Addiction module antidote protein n=2 Tax=Geoalkalibacter ferrihydriticus TaxID=392333 RepID=A0A0C2EA16_9BACT|nr:type II toxin-antitoxin system ParD family antitoxin [Geoalkalibacter ferrihydriticus]KIH75428.1 addiction module antidote protein [Geoalkalibacter ferrihydriticus DSM 17813]SDM92762.1 antitoxin ParD1/3/4 [Geoalkalibacter ferrihydriticus]
MHISLTPELVARVKAKVESGLYSNASEVIREALRFMDAHEEWIYEIKLARLREQIQMGVDQLKQGQGIRIESRKELDKLFDDLRGEPRS